MQASSPIIVTRFSTEQIEAIHAKGIEIESVDYGQCKCGQLRLIIGAALEPIGWYTTYSHGEFLFRVSIDADEPSRQAEVVRLLQEIGCAASS